MTTPTSNDTKNKIPKKKVVASKTISTHCNWSAFDHQKIA